MTSATNYPDLYEASITELQEGLENSLFTSVDLVKAYLARVDEVNVNGPGLRAIIETNPSIIAQAKELDAERKAGGKRGVLHGIPIIVKDNIATDHKEGMNTTAGSYALLGSVVPRDAFVVSALRSAGALILAKANMSEWAKWRGDVESGWSGRGGQASTPYVPNGNAHGSSTGSGIAAAIGLAAGTLGTETDGSIVSPCGRCNIAGIKPTVGLTSRAGVIPISSHQDSVGPMCRTIKDTAILLSVIAGPDPRDPATLLQPTPVPDYLGALDANALRGARLGVPRAFLEPWTKTDEDKHIEKVFNDALDVMRTLGAIVVDPADFPDTKELLSVGAAEKRIFRADFKVELNKYLAGLVDSPTGVRTLADVIRYNENHPEEERIPPWYVDQTTLIESNQTEQDDEYRAAIAANDDISRTRGIDALMKEHNLDAIILPKHGRSSGPAAVAGYPSVIVPLGFQPDTLEPSKPQPLIDIAPGMPFGLLFFGAAWSEYKLLGYAYAFEQATQVRLSRRVYEAAIPKTQIQDVLTA